LKNTHIVINHRGKIVATYHKLHLYDVDIPSENIQTLESSIIEPGNEIIPPVQTPIGNVGLGIVSFFN
jgi:predicted amidohydrolase